ncbi:MAG: TonB-dependent receptor [Mucilaginibacter sp.]|uniref:TonB-dependent receptor n=1 Tax=Mucilaginibacter sp. TaxID=1882438 RepID=UPI003264FEEA
MIIFSILFFSVRLFAQQAATARAKVNSPPPLPFRQVSGVVQDSVGYGVEMATIKLISAQDSILITTDKNGIFVLENVKVATFVLTISELGYKTVVRKYLNNDQASKIVLQPITLRNQYNELKPVNINGTPSIVYKIDTVEYRSSDYKVHANATVDELLKKMEGMEVGADGSLTYMGQQIKKANLNGKPFAGGNVAQAIQTLPADIVDRAQIIDDYGEQAARTGIKDGPSTKTLNLTTKADKSIGTYGSLTTQVGNDDRYNTLLNVIHLDANQQLTLIGKFNNIVTGIANANGNRVGSAGTAKTATPSLGYRDQWDKNIQVNASYVYNFIDNLAVNNSFGEIYSYGQNGLIKNTSSFNSQSTTDNKNEGHNASVEIEYNIDKFNYLQVTPTFNYTNSNSASDGSTDNISNFTTGFEHRMLKSVIGNQNNNRGAGITVLYQHIFKKPKRNFSILIGINTSNNIANGDKFTNYSYYADSTRNTLIKDSTAHLLTKRTNLSTNYNTVITYVEPINSFSQFQFEGKVNHNVYNNNAIADTVLASMQVVELTRLANIYKYSFTETRVAFNYAYNRNKLSFSIGASAIPTVLAGDKINQNTNENVSTSLTNLRVIPVIRLQYAWSNTQRFSLAYSGTNSIPDFQQLQPFTDRSDPNNIIMGNPDLKPAFTNTIYASYNNYLANSRFSYGFNINASDFRDQTVNNIVQVPELISTSPNKYKTINEIFYANLSGSRFISANYTISKQLADRRYNLSLNGNASYGYTLAMSNDVIYHNTNWRLNERFGPRINPTGDFEVNPYIAYDVIRTFTTLAGATPTLLQTISLAVDSKMYFFKNWQVNYSITKSFINGLGDLNTNPLVLNAGFQKEFSQRKNLVLTFNIYDLLHQNNFTQQVVTAQGVTNTLSNILSRYFLVGFRLNVQKWGGTPKRNGKTLKRKGDGSFIY